MQTAYIPRRTDRFDAMGAILATRLPPTFRALDLGAGLGSLSAHVVGRFPKASVVAVDFDPVMLILGPKATAQFDRKVRWVEADLRRRDWTRSLPLGKFDAVLSTTALHWLRPEVLARLYRDVHRLLRPGGIFLNGDKAVLGGDCQRLDELLSESLHEEQRRTFRTTDAEDWGTWWRRVEQTPELRSALAERARRFPPGDHEHPVPAGTHRRMLLRAGFSEADLVWRDASNVLIAALP